MALANSTEYYVVWDANVVKDLANNPIAAQASTTLWSFTTAAAGGFTGLLDTYPTATMAYSFRKLRNAYAGSAVRIRRSSDNLELNVGFDGSGNFDTAAAATHIGGGSGFIVTWFDQSGNAIDVTQATVASQPAYSATGMRSTLPTMTLDGTNDQLLKSIANTALPLATTTVMEVLLDNAAGTGGSSFGWAVSSSNCFKAFATYNDVLYWDVGTDTTGRISIAQPSGWNTGGHLFEVGRESSNDQFITVDGVELIRTSGKTTLPTAGTTNWSVGNAGGVQFGGLISELVIWAADLAANRTAARGNVKTYWGTP